MQSNILYDRFTTLPNIRGHYHRPRIDKLLTKGLESRLVVVTAGAGCGKTQAVSYFMRHSDIDFIWLQLSKLDNYSVRFWENFIHAVSLHNPEIVSRLSAFGFPETPALFHNFLHIFTSLTAGTDKIIFIIDDIHLINEPPVLNFIENLIYARLKNLSVVLIGRSAPDLNIHDLSSDSGAYFLTEDELSFTKKEAEGYFSEQGLILPKDSFDEIYDGTAGWISALYLINISLSKNGGKPLNMVTVAKRQIFELFEREVFLRYSKEMQRRLVGYAVFERIPKDFLKKHSKNALSIINDIEKTNLFIRFNPMTKTYDIHHLFLEFLLEKQDEYLTGEEIKNAHLKAADWYHKNGNEIEALIHYRECGCHEEIWEIISRYETQNTMAIAKLFIELIEDFPEEFKESHPLTAVMYAGQIQQLGKFEESVVKFSEILNKYEKLPDSAENKAVMGEVFIHLGMVSLLSDYKFVNYFKKAAEYLPDGSSIIDNRFSFCDSGFLISVSKNNRGEFDKYVKSIMEAMPYCSKAMNGSGYWVEYAGKAEADYYTLKFKESESAAYTAIYKSEQFQQFDVVSMAYFILVRVYINNGDYAKAANSIEQLDKKMESWQSNPANAPYIKRAVYICAVLKAWFYSRLGDYEKIQNWILNKEERHKAHSYAFFRRDEFIYAYYLLEEQNYQELTGLAESLESFFNMIGFLIPRVKVQILKAILAQKTGNITNAAKALNAAYDLAYANFIIMPFIEYGKYIRTVIYNVRNSSENTIPDVWLDIIYTKAATYEKHLRIIKSQHNQTYRHAPDSLPKITKREKEILVYLCQGLTNAEIANSCFITVSAVKKMLNNIYIKLGVKNRVEAVRTAVQMELNK